MVKLIIQVQKALGGDTRAAEFIRDTSGQKPSAGIAIGNVIDMPSEKIDLASMSNAKLCEIIEQKEADR